MKWHILGDRYSSDRNNQIAVSFTTQAVGSVGWRVILFDMSTGNEVYELRSDGTEIASFVGGEFLATAPTSPQVLLLGEDPTTHNDVVMIRFDRTAAGGDPFGAVAWYPLGAPGVGASADQQPLYGAGYGHFADGSRHSSVQRYGLPIRTACRWRPFPITSNASGCCARRTSANMPPANCSSPMA